MTVQLFHVFVSFIFFFFTLQYCIGFAIHWHESATGVYIFWWVRCFSVLWEFSYVTVRIFTLGNRRSKSKSLVSSVQFSRSVMSDSLWPHESQHARPPCPSPTLRVHSNSRPSSQWCPPAISPSVVSLIPFSSCPQSLPASESFPMRQLFAWGDQSIGVSALASSLQRNPRADLLQNGLVGSPCSPRDSQESSPAPLFKSINSSVLSFFTVQLSHPYMTTGKTIAFTRWSLVGKVMSLLLICYLGWSKLFFQGVSSF